MSRENRAKKAHQGTVHVKQKKQNQQKKESDLEF
jgi:hypothetical protein